MHYVLKEDIQKIISHKEDMTMQKNQTTVKQSVNSALAKLGRCMETLEEDNHIEMGKLIEETDVESASCDE